MTLWRDSLSNHPSISQALQGCKSSAQDVMSSRGRRASNLVVSLPCYDDAITGKRSGVLLLHRRDGMADLTGKNTEALGGQREACKAYQNKILFSITTLRVVHLSCYSLHNRYLN